MKFTKKILVLFSSGSIEIGSFLQVAGLKIYCPHSMWKLENGLMESIISSQQLDELEINTVS